ncbi:hypothetical protein NLJ89_g774 [Agrocybe chaxingu]|uniref:Zn(2)-C6 fungal-type domain-containing protein n=1 Tax=Agrocybe chaxingu TaxID=84603 RepID=A0A9W8N1G0_9AGAR|nr:hypothetical protein NLJ89_g774 [Agrocybe chaxingu]
MSSTEGEENAPNASTGTQRRPRACDTCRRKKIRCDGPESTDMICSTCDASGLNCTYIASLEDRIEELIDVLRRLCPDQKIFDNWIASLSEERPRQILINPSDLTHSRQPTTGLQFPPPSIFGPKPVESLTKAIRAAHNDNRDPPEGEDDIAHIPGTSLDTSRFFGKSSGEALARTVLSMKYQCVGDGERPLLSHRREEFWTLRPWERISQTFTPRRYEFPDPALGKDLVDLYFTHLNVNLPLLHRPSFERSIRDGLHFVHDGFASVYLLVCAIGARFSTDLRVLLDGVDSYHSAGWKWYDQVETGKTSFLSLPSLYDLQLYCLTIVFLHSSSAPQSVWTMIGIAIRLAQDVGAHRRTNLPPTVESELWKRAWWALICIDRTICLSLGRPLTIHDADFDLDLPIDCDDEYWEHPDPNQRFKQPPNKPSSTTYFILQIKLFRILSYCVRAIYSLHKKSVHLGLVGDQWKLNVVRELDSCLNSWMGSIPEHLRWDPERKNDKFFSQSAMLHALGYYGQILVHRPFIPSPSKPSSLPFPSLLICTNAARACINVAYAQHQRDMPPPPPIQIATFTASVVLMFNIWGTKTLNSSSEQAADRENVAKAMRVLKAAEDRWHQSGRLWDILSDLSSKGQRPLEDMSESLLAASSEPTDIQEQRQLFLPSLPTRWYQVQGKQRKPREPVGDDLVTPPPLNPLTLPAQDYWNFASHDYHLNDRYLPKLPVRRSDSYPTSGPSGADLAMEMSQETSWTSQEDAPSYFPQLAPLPFHTLPTALNVSALIDTHNPTQNLSVDLVQLDSQASTTIDGADDQTVRRDRLPQPEHPVEAHSVVEAGWVTGYSDGDSLWSAVSPEYGVDNISNKSPVPSRPRPPAN